MPWDAKATSYEAIGEQIKASGAQSVYLGGIVCNNGVKLLKDLRAAVGPKPSSSGPTAGRRTRPPSAPARRPRACTSATRASRSKARPARARSSSRSSGRTRRSRATCLRTPSTRPRRRRSCSTRSRARTARVLGGQGAVQDERQERHHGHVPLRQERRHRSAQVDQLRPAARARTGCTCSPSSPRSGSRAGRVARENAIVGKGPSGPFPSSIRRPRSRPTFRRKRSR